MNLKEKIENDFKVFMKEKNIIWKNILWTLKTKILMEEKAEKRIKLGIPFTENDVLQIIQKEANALKEIISVEWMKENLKQEAIDQLNIIEKYLPTKLSLEEVIEKINQNISNWNLNKDMWSIMRYTKQNFQWQIDMNELSNYLKTNFL